MSQPHNGDSSAADSPQMDGSEDSADSDAKIERVCGCIEEMFAPHEHDKLMTTLLDATLLLAREGLVHE